LVPVMSELKPPSQNSPGAPPRRRSTAISRAAASPPTTIRDASPSATICPSFQCRVVPSRPRPEPFRNRAGRAATACRVVDFPSRLADSFPSAAGASSPSRSRCLVPGRNADFARNPDFERLEEFTAIRRPHRAPPSPNKDGPRINDEIRVREVQLIDTEGTNHGTVPIERALAMAAEAGLDLVEISPNNNPPVTKILDYGRFKYQSQKKAAEARKKQKTVEIKEIKMRPNIDIHDYEVKMRSVRRFFEEGDKVKVTLRFRGREMAHQEIGMRLLDRVKEEISPIAKVEAEPRLEGRQMTMVLAPR
jgi:translation initiation factor IF-3